MRADDTGCDGEVRRVCADSGRGDLGYGDGRRVGSENGVRRADVGEAGEDGGFEGGDFGHGFDDEVNGGKIFHVGSWGYAGTGKRGFGSSEALFQDGLLEEVVYL